MDPLPTSSSGRCFGSWRQFQSCTLAPYQRPVGQPAPWRRRIEEIPYASSLHHPFLLPATPQERIFKHPGLPCIACALAKISPTPHTLARELFPLLWNVSACGSTCGSVAPCLFG